ncbi:hypothetical protein ACFYSJ_08215 [Streptomyces sp. NPDC005248]
MSERTLMRMATAYRERGPMGLADGRWAPSLRGHASIMHTTSLHRSL